MRKETANTPLLFKSRTKLSKAGSDKNLYKIAFDYFREGNATLKSALKNTKIFLNMVIHDLRNPTSQIKFTVNIALDKLCETRELARKRQKKLDKLGSIAD